MCKKLRATLKIKKRKKYEGSDGSSWAAVEAAAGTAEAGTEGTTLAVWHA